MSAEDKINECPCGYTTGEKNKGRMVECSITEALQNHVYFPSLSLLSIENEHSRLYYDTTNKNSAKPLASHHWAFLLNIQNSDFKIHGFEGKDRIVYGKTHLEEETYVTFKSSSLSKTPSTFSWEDIQPGRTLAILYAEKSMMAPTHMNAIKQNNLDMCYVFNGTIDLVKQEAKLLLNDADLLNKLQEHQCFSCNLKDKKIMKCGKCKLAKYCSQGCQLNHWREGHKRLCSQSEVLLRLASLPRQSTFNGYFTFNLNASNPIAPYVYKPEFIQKPIKEAGIKKRKPVIEGLNSNTKCGLCGKTDKEAFEASGNNLTKTDCCSNWICDDENNYKIGTFARNSCNRNHRRYTICHFHYENKHSGKWQQCKKCQNSFKKIMYDDHATNKYNFEKLKNVKKEEIWCRICGFTSYNLSDFAGAKPCCMIDDNYYCRKASCMKEGNLFGPPDAPFIYQIDRNHQPPDHIPYPLEARLEAMSSRIPGMSKSSGLSRESLDELMSFVTQMSKNAAKQQKN